MRLRFVQPVLAVLTGGDLLAWAGAFWQGSGRLERVLTAIMLVQWAPGGLNVILLAPVGLQVVLLLLADLSWSTLVLLVLAIGEWEGAGLGEMAGARQNA